MTKRHIAGYSILAAILLPPIAHIFIQCPIIPIVLIITVLLAYALHLLDAI